MPPSGGPLTQAALWDVVGAALAPGDLVVADQGTSYYGLGPHHLPHDAIFLGQPLWAAIGYTLPAILGAALAAPGRRPVLLIGDGAAQLTIQELGHAPEPARAGGHRGRQQRRLHRRARDPRSHEALQRHRAVALDQLADAFGASRGAACSARVETVRGLADALADARAHPDRLTLVEAVTDPLDVPPLLVAVAEAAARANARR